MDIYSKVSSLGYLFWNVRKPKTDIGIHSWMCSQGTVATR